MERTSESLFPLEKGNAACPTPPGHRKVGERGCTPQGNPAERKKVLCGEGVEQTVCGRNRTHSVYARNRAHSARLRHRAHRYEGDPSCVRQHTRASLPPRFARTVWSGRALFGGSFRTVRTTASVVQVEPVVAPPAARAFDERQGWVVDHLVNPAPETERSRPPWACAPIPNLRTPARWTRANLRHFTFFPIAQDALVDRGWC